MSNNQIISAATKEHTSVISKIIESNLMEQWRTKGMAASPTASMQGPTTYYAWKGSCYQKNTTNIWAGLMDTGS
jgi:hypothetical protein